MKTDFEYRGITPDEFSGVMNWLEAKYRSKWPCDETYVDFTPIGTQPYKRWTLRIGNQTRLWAYVVTDLFPGGIMMRLDGNPNKPPEKYFVEFMEMIDREIVKRLGQPEAQSETQATPERIEQPINIEPNFGKNPDVRKRRKWMWENKAKILDNELTSLQIAEQWGVSEHTVNDDRKELGIKFRG
jgi:hypothetical protein